MNISQSLPVTAGIEQTRVAKQGDTRPQSAQVLDKTNQIPSAAEVSVQHAQSEQRQNAIPKDPEIAAEQIRVSVTTGESNIRGNLTPVKAAEIYQTIAKLL